MSPSPERWRLLEELYRAAVERAPVERAAFLQEACPDKDLRREVESLLRFEHKGDTLMQHSPLAPSSGLKPGMRLGPYEVESRLGAGGMGEVWKARDTRLERSVAVKVSKTEFSKRFEREARAIAALNHPNIAQVYDVGENYLVMEFIDGAPLKPTGDTRRLLDLALQIADGLSAAHSAGIVHRDLKPDNVLITKDGRIKILDFGLAKQETSAESPVTNTATMTEAGMVVGTVDYMSPEQARGQALDHRSDQFSFGLILYELATGKRAFRRESAAETMAAIIRDEAEPLPSTIPAPVRWTIERCMAKESDHRYDSTRDLYRELKQIREHLSQSSDGIAAAPAPVARRKRRRLLLAAVALVCLAAGIFMLLFASPSGPDLSQYKFTRVAPGEIEERTPAWSPDGNSIAYSARVHGVRQLFVRAIGGRQAAQLTTSSKDCYDPFWSPNGESIYYLTDRSLWSVPASGGTPQAVTKDVDAAAIHPDGKTLAFARDDKLWLAALHGGPAKQFWPGPLAPTVPETTMRFSPDGSWLAFDNGTVWAFTYPSGKPRKLYTGTENGNYGGVIGLSWFPDSRSLLVARNSASDSLIRLAVPDGTRQTIYSTGPSLMAPSVSPDGKRIAFSAGHYEWNIVEIGLTDGGVHTVIENGDTNVSPDWAPSGTHFLFSTQGAIMDQEASGGEFSRRLIDTSYDTGEARWSPDGARFVFVDNGTINKLMLANASGGHATLLDHADRIASVAWSPDGQWISYGRMQEGHWKLAKIRDLPGASPAILADVEDVNGTAWLPGAGGILYGAANGLELISPDGNSPRKLSSRHFAAYGFAKDGGHAYGIFHNTTGTGPQWQLYDVNVTTKAEKLVAPVELPPSTGRIGNLSIHPDGKRALASIAEWPFQIWMLEGFDHPRSKSWFTGWMAGR